MENQFQSTLFLLTQQLMLWEDDFTSPPQHLNQCLNRLTKYLIDGKRYCYPKNYKELINFLITVPVNEWTSNQEDYEDEFFGETLINIDGRVNGVFINWLEEMGTLEEGQQKEMKKFLLKCRELTQKDNREKYERYYREGRQFVSASNMIIDSIKLRSILNTFPKELSKIINQWTEYYDTNNEELYVCPVCGKPLDFSDSPKGRCSSVCEYYRKDMNESCKKKIIDKSLIYNTFTKGIYKYILIPAIAEEKIYNNLKDKFEQYTVELYPEIDKYDIRISNDNIVIDIDVKDHMSPFGLVSVLLNNQDVSKLYSKREDHFIYLVIPQHRKDIYSNKGDYKRDLGSLLQTYDLKIEVLYENELYKVIDKIFNDDF